VNPYRAPFALLTVLMFVAMMPPLMWFIGNVSNVTPTEQFLISLVPVGMALLTVVSWVEPA